MLFLVMPNWRVRFEGRIVHLLHVADGNGPLWSGPVEIVRGAPSAESHPELQHAFMALDNPAPHQDFIRHRWNYEIPDNYRGLSNLGDGRQYLILQASGGMLNWTLDLKLPLNAPRFVYKAICRAFHATLKENPMKPAGPDATNKSAQLTKGTVPPPQMPAPPAAKEGIASLFNEK